MRKLTTINSLLTTMQDIPLGEHYDDLNDTHTDDLIDTCIQVVCKNTTQIDIDQRSTLTVVDNVLLSGFICILSLTKLTSYYQYIDLLA